MGRDLNCNSKMVVNLVQCKTCNKQYVGSASTNFRLRFYNYKCCHRKYNLTKTVPQHSFHTHFNANDHIIVWTTQPRPKGFFSLRRGGKKSWGRG